MHSSGFTVSLHPSSSSSVAINHNHRHRFRETSSNSILVFENENAATRNMNQRRSSPPVTLHYSSLTENEPQSLPSQLPSGESFHLNEDDYKDKKNIIVNGASPSQSSSSVYAPSVILPMPSPMPGDCDVKRYILDHATYYDGDSTFLAGPTQRTQKALSKFKKLLAKEREAGGVLSVDTTTPSTITSHAPGFLLSKDEDIIVGMQSDEPLKRTCKPHGGYGVVKNALIAYGYEPGEKLKAFKDDVVTHNDLTFSMYTSKVSRNCEHRLLIEAMLTNQPWCSRHLYFASYIYNS